MMKHSVCILIFILLLSLLTPAFIYPQNIPQQAGSAVEKTEQDIQRERELREKITRPREEEEKIGTITEEGGVPLEPEKKVQINRIEVRGVTLLPEKTISGIISQFEGKELSLREMQMAADLVTDEYRKNGYVTSRAYLPPQTIKDGLLTIMVIEGKVGSLETRGNRFFRTALLEKKIHLRPSDKFDYKSLQRSLRIINEHPDRKVKAVLVPGKEPGTTDIILEVTDRLPLHAGVEFDNYGSRYIDRWRFAAIGEHNNLLGCDDKLYFKYQKAQSSNFNLINGRYTIPVIPDWTELGVYYLWSKVRLLKDFKDLRVRGRSTLTGLFLTQTILNEYEMDLKLNFGFDYKKINNYMLGNEVSRDYARVVKGGFDLDMYDPWGRSILVFETDVGIPNILDGADKEGHFASRTGARGDFTKFVANFYRLQPLPFASTILWKNQLQVANRTLFSSEQFQVGGITNVRAYSPAEISGDCGYASTVEWLFPILKLLPKAVHDIKVPLSKSTFYQATRFVAFYDLGAIYNNKKLPGERKSKFLNGYGFGFRFDLPENFSTRIEFATPLGSDPSDGKEFHTYFGITAKY